MKSEQATIEMEREERQKDNPRKPDRPFVRTMMPFRVLSGRIVELEYDYQVNGRILPFRISNPQVVATVLKLQERLAEVEGEQDGCLKERDEALEAKLKLESELATANRKIEGMKRAK